jgi:hypothetical protein
MKNNAVLTNPLRRKRFEVGDRYLIHVAQDGEEYAVHHTTLVPATWVIVTSITDTAVTDQHPIESRWLNSESRWLNSRGVDDFIPYPLRNVFSAGDCDPLWRSTHRHAAAFVSATWSTAPPSITCHLPSSSMTFMSAPSCDFSSTRVRGQPSLPCTPSVPGCWHSHLGAIAPSAISLRSINWHRCGSALESRVGPDLCHMGIRGGGAGPVPRPFCDTRCAD